ncbi:uncharacterized protein LOC117174945, partial [Belonocnema kinseyi]|uniref:uncharacterized protein LOC117174945 n=1 Tax=Belonocnema kinseyi TaxID=2817044 RepID=UPI00143D06CA
FFLGDTFFKINQKKGTPRIIRAIRQQSVKFDLHRNSLSNSTLSLDKTASIIYYNKSTCRSTSTSSKSPVRFSKSDEVLKTRSPVNHSSKRDPSSNRRLNTVQTAQLFEPAPSSRKQKKCKTVEGGLEPTESSFYNQHFRPFDKRTVNKLKTLPRNFRSSEDRFKIPSYLNFDKKNCPRNREKKRINEKRRGLPKEKCYFSSSSESSQVNLMDRCPNLSTEDITPQRQRAGLTEGFGLGFLMQHMQKSQFKEATDEKDKITNFQKTKRTFPFQNTPSGNLKIIPNQVVYESKKVSVLVADPRNTRVNVKAQLEKPGLNSEIAGQDPIEIPPGVTPSTINQLQVQEKLPRIPTIYRPRTQPYRPKPAAHPGEMEHKLTAEKGTHRLPLPPTEEIPLSSLGFTVDQPIDWENIILPEKTDLYRELARRITNYKNADCIVRLEEDEFHCHLIVLQSYSTFFDEKNIKEVDLTGSSVTSRAFSIIYDWMINSRNESCQLLRRDNILEIFVAAQYLGIKELEEQCWAFIDNDDLFSEDTAFLLYLEARKIGNTAVMELMVPRIMKFFLMLVSTKDFLELSVDELCLLLKSNYICVNSEMEVLMSAVRWLMCDWQDRKMYMLDVLKCVRFGLIAPWQLVDVKRNPENPEFMELMSCPEVQKMVDDGLAFVIIKYWYGNQTEDYYHWIDLLGLTEPTNRNWAGEDKNYVTYREFLLYLEEYRKTQLPQLKTRSSRAKPTPPNSSPKESPTPPARTRSIYPQNYPNFDHNSHGLSASTGNNPLPSPKQAPKTCPSGFQPAAMASETIFPPEILNDYLKNLDRNSNGLNRSTMKNQK